MDTSDICIHNCSLYWYGKCTLIIIIKDIIETEKNRYLWHMYTWPFTVLLLFIHISEVSIVSMISFIIIIINVHVPDQYSERSCIHVSEVSIVSLFLWYLLLLLLLLMYMYQTTTVNGHVYMWETEKQWIPLTHVYMTVHCTGLVHVD
jgi:hypothetical protein